jgi:hypothetical protein
VDGHSEVYGVGTVEEQILSVGENFTIIHSGPITFVTTQICPEGIVEFHGTLSSVRHETFDTGAIAQLGTLKEIQWFRAIMEQTGPRDFRFAGYEEGIAISFTEDHPAARSWQFRFLIDFPT